MENTIVQLSKYVITFLMICFTVQSFAALKERDEDERHYILMRQIIMIILMNFICFFVMFLQEGEVSTIQMFLLTMAYILGVQILYRLIYRKASMILVNNMCMLLSIGFVILTRLDMKKAVKQFIIVAGALAIALLIPFLIEKIRFLKKLKWIYALIGILALSVVLILGQTTYGSKLSYSIGGVTFQPSEFVKILFVFFVASALYEASGFLEVFTTAVVAAAHVIVLVISKDLGSALIFFVVYVLMVYVSTKNPLYVAAGAGGGAAAAYLAFKVFRHVQVRVQAWKDPWSVIDSAGYQITQSLFAISSGGFFGLGLYKGTPESIPTVEADFIFSAIAEELGILFAVCLILICVSCFIMFMNISIRLNDRFYQLIAFGFGVTYIFQVFLTIGGVTKFIPSTGVTLPLISYGGSSVASTLIIFAVMQGIFIIAYKEDDEDEEEQSNKKNESNQPK